MPSEHAPESRPSLDAYRSNGSSRSQRHSTHDTSSDSPSNTPPSTSHKVKGIKPHLVGTRLHTRVPSHGKALHKQTKAHSENHASAKGQRRSLSAATSPESPPMKRSGSEPKLSSRNASTTSLKKNSSHVSLKRNRSHAEVKRPKSTGALKRSSSQPGVDNSRGLHRTSVHFDLGNDAGNDAGDDAWTEASGSASPELSRSGSAAGQSSGRSSARPPASATNSQTQSIAGSPTATRDWTPSRQNENHSAFDAHQITSRLLQRTPSLSAAPKMSSVSATATNQSPEYNRSGSTTANGTPRTTHQEELTSRFVGTNSASGTPGSTSPYHASHSSSDPKADVDSSRRAKPMNNLARRQDSGSDSDERPLAPRSRKSSNGTHAYNPPQQSRTQQKLWLQRASSNIEPQQLAPGAAINGLGLGIGLPGIRPGEVLAPLVGAGDDGKDPRIRLQLEKTGQEYMVVRRYQDPVGRAIKRLDQLPGADKHRRIPKHRTGERNGMAGDGRSSYGLSQSMSERRRANRDVTKENGTLSATGTRSSYEAGSLESERSAGDDDGVSAILRSMWEKNPDLNASEE